jgi:hypothetical protein
MSEEGKKKAAKCGNCTVQKHTNYDCQDCEKEFCSDCTKLRPVEHIVIVNYCGSWRCNDCRESKPDSGTGGNQEKDELIAKLVSVVDRL